jgi:Xaa-Pro aminopeptidase
MLTEAERTWLNGYHARVRETLRPLITDKPTLNWLDKVTEAV